MNIVSGYGAAGDVSERRQWRMKRGKRSGGNLAIGKQEHSRRQSLSYNRKRKRRNGARNKDF